MTTDTTIALLREAREIGAKLYRMRDETVMPAEDDDVDRLVANAQDAVGRLAIALRAKLTETDARRV